MRPSVRALAIVLLFGVVFFYGCGSAITYHPDEREVEKAMVETAVRALMADEGITDLSEYPDGTPTGAPVRTYSAGDATNDMTSFPSAVWKLCSPTGSLLHPSRCPTTQWYYTVETDGTVRQFADPGKTEEYSDD